MQSSHDKLNGRSAGPTLAVRLLSASRQRGRLIGGGLSLACAIGRSGLTADKREGDGASPRGVLTVLGGFYRPDRFGCRPPAALPLAPLRPNDGWCDAPGHAAYNRHVRLPFAASHERLWRDDHVYDIVLITDWNYTHRQRQRGSAIFFHLTEAGERPTQGCIAIARADMLKLLPRLTPGTRLVLG